MYIYYDKTVIATLDGAELYVDDQAARAAGMPEDWIPHIRRLLLNALPEGVRYDALVVKALRNGDRPSRSIELLPYIGELPARFSLGENPDIAPENKDDVRTYSFLPRDLPYDIPVVSHIPVAWYQANSEARTSAKPSFSGFQDKFLAKAVVDDEQRMILSVPTERERGNVLTKPTQIDHPYIPRNEYVCMQLAEAAGLVVPRTFLYQQKDMPTSRQIERHIIIERFDMRVVDGIPRKLEVSEFATFMNLDGSTKYNASTEDLFEVALEKLSPNDVKALARAYFFGMCVHNNDMHVKNFSIFVEPETGEYKLTPIYDMLCVAAEGDYPGRTALPLRGSSNPKNDVIIDFLGKYLAPGEMRFVTDAIQNNVAAVVDYAYDDNPRIKTAGRRLKDIILEDTRSFVRAIDRALGVSREEQEHDCER